MERLRSDSPECRRIVSAFIDFLSTVEPAPGVDLEGLEVARECLQEVFELNRNNHGDQVQSGLLLELFRSVGISEEHGNKSDYKHTITSTRGPDLAPVQTFTSAGDTAGAAQVVESMRGRSHLSEVANDELFGQFCGALERVHFFNPTTAGDDDHVRLSKAKRMFDDALIEMEKSGCQITDTSNLAENLKSLGNRVMQSGNYQDAIEYYTCAIALSENNAIYYCNRAAAYTQIHSYAEAILDCKKAIMINPNYSKAYSRLGMAYYGLGNYRDAINMGYLKALELDPNNRSILENIRVAEQKLRDELRRTEGVQFSGTSHGHDQSNQSSSASWSWGNGVPPPFTFPANLPANIAEVITNMAANAYTGTGESNDSSSMDDANSNGSEIRIGGNMAFNLSDGTLPEELSNAWRSAMNMFSSPSGPQGNTERDSSSGPN